MQAVILAAGKSTRTYPLTAKRPKPLLKILDKTVLEHNLDQLKGIADEVIIITGFMKEEIIKKFGAEYKGIRLKYAEQKEQLGTGHAIMSARPHLKDRFLVLNGDDLLSKTDLEKMAKHDYATLVKKVDDVRMFGAAIVEENKVIRIIEKPSENISPYACTGCHVLKKDIFEIELKKTKRGEYEITDYLSVLAGRGVLEHEILEGYWLPIGYPWNYLEANVSMLNMKTKSETHPESVIENGVTMKGVVLVGKGTVIRSGTYIEGPVFIGKGCEIGPDAYLRKNTIIMDGVRTRAEIIDSVLMDGCTAKHTCYIGHSVIGERSNIAAGTITADYRHDACAHTTFINGKRVKTERKKLGAFIGDDVKTGIGTLIYPGRKIWPGMNTLPGEIVKKDIS